MEWKGNSAEFRTVPFRSGPRERNSGMCPTLIKIQKVEGVPAFAAGVSAGSVGSAASETVAICYQMARLEATLHLEAF